MKQLLTYFPFLKFLIYILELINPHTKLNTPTGIVTFLFTDIQSSTKLAQEFPDILQNALDRHHSIMQKAMESNNGFIFEIVGDAFCCSFEKAEDAVRAAVEAQLNLAKEEWNEVVIKVRMGIHSGRADWNESRYTGYITLARTARIMSAAYGEQILISNDSYSLLFRSEEFKIQNHKIETLSLRDFEIISFRDLGERRLKDVIQPIRLFQVLYTGLRADFPPLKTPDARPNNLQVQLTSFIGREDEIKIIKNLLKQTRLLTLTGSGGAGKTRLALKVAEDLIDDFANGVWCAELAAIINPALLLQEIVNIFGLKEDSRGTPEDTLYDHLKDKEVLLILDNCEHLVEACAVLAEKLLSYSPKLKILSTSREALKSKGEQIHRVPSLEIPDPKIEISIEKLMEYESVRLFTERALSVDESFRVNSENARALASICCQLDGIPLAIELAAARIKIMSIEKIQERLNDRFNLLTGGNRTALPRQQTLRALTEWSYDLLSEQEKLLWKRLSVFSGGWTLEAAEEVCSDDIILKRDIIDLLNYLTEKSIIIYQSGKERYRILETLKQFGKEKLIESGSHESILLRHLNYYMEFSETAEPKLNESDVLIWLDKLESEQSNFQCAIEWSIKSGNAESGARLAGALGGFWNIRWHYTAGYRLLDSILKNCSGVSKAVFIKVLSGIGLLTRNQGEYEKAEKYLKRSLKLSKEAADKQCVAVSLNGLAKIAEEKGNYDNAQKLYEESLQISRASGDKINTAVSLNGLGIVSRFKGNYEEALKYYEESLLIRRETGDIRGIANTLHNLGMLAEDMYDFEQSKKYYEESLKLRRKICDKLGITGSLNGLAKLEMNYGNFETAKKIFEESLVLKREIGDKPGIAGLLNNLGIVAFVQENYDLSQKYYEEGLAIGQEINDSYIKAASLNNLGELAFNSFNFEEAEMYFEQGLELETEMGTKPGIAHSKHNLGNVFLFKGNFESALKNYTESIILFKELKDNRSIVYTLIGLAGAYSQDKPRLGATLLGGIDSAVKSEGITLINEEQKFRSQITEMLNKKLSVEEFRKYFADGKNLSLEETIQFAISND